MPSNIMCTTLPLPTELLAGFDQAVRPGRVRSRNTFVAGAIRRELAAREEAAIDPAFAGMANDADSLVEVDALMDEFAASDWEAFRAEPESR